VSAAREAAVALDPAAPEALFAKLRPGPGLAATDVAEHQRTRIRRAMIEAVVERGYDAVTVRELARLAGVSTRAFYQHYASKQECLLDTHRLIVRRLLQRLSSSQVGARDGGESVELAFHALLDEWRRDPQAARLALVEAYAPGPVVLEQTRRANRAVEARIAEALDRAGGGVEMPPFLIEAVVAGTIGVARSRLLTDREGELSGLGVPLTQWALSYRSPVVAELHELDRGIAPRLPKAPQKGPTLPSGDLPLLLSAVGKLTAADGYESLTVQKVLAAAGVPRRAFYANFSDLDDCVIEAIEMQAAQGIARARCASKTGSTAAGGTYRAVLVLCDRVAGDPVFAGLCFGGVATLGVRGMRCREGLIGDLQKLVETGRGSESPADRIAAEASADALWSALENKVAAGRACQVPRLAATLTYLILAPAVGASAAIEAIRKEQM
jgi:AcrR family transcriptional regulator